ncbi:hypothetical protein Sango_2323100 [Sesamum angolense]|uniref:Endonuclease/exonuclease/phosphatase domain-containing protein n=1 Tax=Sesamum angolense TaxID=2727404 RepID=A0AAE1WAQ6_9LAMI|nr:hypothetical protein Sango_2323100 [Sesamum angolense]
MYGFSVPSRGRSGGLAVLWVKLVNAQLQKFSHNHVDFSVQLAEGLNWWRFTGIYGKLDNSKRDLTWNLLARLSAQSSRPWICTGDFNEILARSEKCGSPPRPNWQIQNFKRALSVSGLSDIGFSGSLFTWSNRHIFPNTVLAWLDRACANMGWSQLFPETMVSHIQVNCSNHKALLIRLVDSQGYVPRSSRPWRFEATWLQSEQCEEIVAKS